MLVAVPGGRAQQRRPTDAERVLVPRSRLAARAGITPVVVPDDIWVSPWLLRRPVEDRPALRVVA